MRGSRSGSALAPSRAHRQTLFRIIPQPPYVVSASIIAASGIPSIPAIALVHRTPVAPLVADFFAQETAITRTRWDATKRLRLLS
jgi:hypothetical protein